MAGMTHWRFGGSTAERTINCPGWRQLADRAPTPPTSPYAHEGAVLHDCMERILLEQTTVNTLHGETIDGIEIDDDRHRRLVAATNAFVTLSREYGMAEYEPEVGAEYAHDVGGHADFVGVSEDGKTVFVGDFKFGSGYQIDPFENAQAMFYAFVLRAGSPVADMFQKAEQVALVIIQPNDRDMDTLRIWTAPMGAIDEFELSFEKALRRARQDNPPLRVGEHCRFCPAAALCPERTGMAHRALLMPPDDLEQLADCMSMLPSLRDWINEVEQTALRQLERGAEVPGYKLVQKRAIRRWSEDEDVIYKKLARKLGGRKAMTVSKLCSPAQAAKLAKARGVDPEVIEEYVVAQSSGYAVAHAEDKRPEALPPHALGAALAALGKAAD